jgi:hypothetical protein
MTIKAASAGLICRLHLNAICAFDFLKRQPAWSRKSGRNLCWLFPVAFSLYGGEKPTNPVYSNPRLVLTRVNAAS